MNLEEVDTSFIYEVELYSYEGPTDWVIFENDLNQTWIQTNN